MTSVSTSMRATEEANVLLKKNDIARFGNGHNKDLTELQLDFIDQLYVLVEPYRQKLEEQKLNCETFTIIPHDKNDDFCDLEMCRRYLVAREWSLEKAKKQLISTFEREIQIVTNSTTNDPKEFWQSPKALNDPHSLSLRWIGWDDIEGRPIAYTCFAEAHDRFDVSDNMQHLDLCLRAGTKLFRTRRKRGMNTTASARQWILGVDFYGFGLRDNNPKTAVYTARLLQHYPEMLSMVILLGAPLLFGGFFRVISPLIDDRVRAKIIFLKVEGSNDTMVKCALNEKIGPKASAWICNEMKDNRQKRKDKKKYWVAPSQSQKDMHDPRGIDTYVSSDMYIKTPGDAFEEQNR